MRPFSGRSMKPFEGRVARAAEDALRAPGGAR
jgi:hypothetical protein